MVKLRQNSAGNYTARKRLPRDVQEEYGRLYGAHVEAKFSAPASVGLDVAKQQFRDWETEVANRIANIRAVQRGTGIDLTRKDALGLAGEWYKWFIARHEDDPGKPERWDDEFWGIIDELQRFAPDEVRAEPMRDLEWTRDPDVRSGIRPMLADRGHTAQFLASRGIALTHAAHALFLDCVLDNYIPALSLLERRAKGDYEPDDLPRQFPPFSASPALTADAALSPWDLFEAWVKAKQPAQSTVESWRTVFRALSRDCPDRSASTITPDEAQAWLDKQVTENRSRFTVRNTWLKATNTVFAWGTTRKLTTNPFAAVVMEVPRRKKHRPKWFHEHERTTILKAAKAVEDTSNPDDAARRWVPWLLAYSGARPQEITQLRGRDVQQVDGIWTLNLTPEAGTSKTGEARQVPLHDHLIEQAFLEFAKSCGDGPLFYRPRKKQSGSVELMQQRKAPAAQVRQRLAAWVRDIGVNDEHLSPLHAWRHTFKLIGRRIEHDYTMLDYICGHAQATAGREYGEPTLTDLARVIQRFPRYEV